MKRGLRFQETMSGTYALSSAPNDRRRFSFEVEARADSWTDYLRTGRTHITGTLEAEGFADGVPLEGRLTLLPLTKRTIRYEFNFTANDGNPYRFAGQKSIRWRSPVTSFTYLPGAVYDSSGREVAVCKVYFNARRDLVRFLASWRPA
jgi:hypothetical protein